MSLEIFTCDSTFRVCIPRVNKWLNKHIKPTNQKCKLRLTNTTEFLSTNKAFLKNSNILGTKQLIN